MAGQFNLVAELVVMGPRGLDKVVKKVQDGVRGIKANVGVDITSGATRKLKTLNTRLTDVSKTLSGMSTNATSVSNAFVQMGNASTVSARKQAKANNSVSGSIKSVSSNLGVAADNITEFGKQSALAIRRFAAFSLAAGALIGVVVNNSIVLIDLVNRLRNEGWNRFDAIMEAGKQRFRPILMTAFTTIGGLIPMAMGNTQMIGIPYSPMGRTIIGGLLTSTLLSLIAVPWAYTLFDDMRNYFKKIAALYIFKSKTEKSELVEVESN